MTTKELIAANQQYMMQTYHGQFPVAIARGEGARYWDYEGKQYLDFTAGIAVNALGACDPRWVQAICNQAQTLGHVSNLYYTAPCVEVAKRLVTRTGMTNVFFGNSGAEANEGLLKMARKYSFDHYGKGRSKVITLRQSFHGRTMTTLTATGQDVFHNYFFPFAEGFDYVPANDFDALCAAATDDTCAILMEMVQGEGGVIVLDRDYVQQVAKLCRDRDILLLVDEVQTGVGRTGTLFAFQQYDILPDGVSFAKGIAGGLPMGGFLAGEKTAHTMDGQHGSTFGGNPICCAAATAVLDAVDDDLLADVAAKGAYLKEQIAKLPGLEDVRGLGMLLGATVVGQTAGDLATKLTEQGLLVLTAQQNTLRFAPPLTITRAELDEGIAILQNTLRA
jgi:acetylornithine/N-succinyldiaminopimelate aminotransferase